MSVWEARSTGTDTEQPKAVPAALGCSLQGCSLQGCSLLGCSLLGFLLLSRSLGCGGVYPTRALREHLAEEDLIPVVLALPTRVTPSLDELERVGLDKDILRKGECQRV